MLDIQQRLSELNSMEDLVIQYTVDSREVQYLFQLEQMQEYISKLEELGVPIYTSKKTLFNTTARVSKFLNSINDKLCAIRRAYDNTCSELRQLTTPILTLKDKEEIEKQWQKDRLIDDVQHLNRRLESVKYEGTPTSIRDLLSRMEEQGVKFKDKEREQVWNLVASCIEKLEFYQEVIIPYLQKKIEGEDIDIETTVMNHLEKSRDCA